MVALVISSFGLMFAENTALSSPIQLTASPPEVMATAGNASSFPSDVSGGESVSGLPGSKAKSSAERYASIAIRAGAARVPRSSIHTLAILPSTTLIMARASVALVMIWRALPAGLPS